MKDVPLDMREAVDVLEAGGDIERVLSLLGQAKVEAWPVSKRQKRKGNRRPKRGKPSRGQSKARLKAAKKSRHKNRGC